MRLSQFLLLFFIMIAFPASRSWSQLIVAHRGASYDAPENTLAAFRLAWEQGSDGIEGDFYLTADQQIVCIHDSDTKRTCGTNLVVEKSTLSQLRKLEYGSWKGSKWRGEPIPTLEQVMETVPDGKLFVIELKSKKGIAPVVARKLERLDTSRIKLLIIAFDAETVAECKRLMPSVRAHWLTRFESKPSSRKISPTAKEVAETVERIGADGVGMKAQKEVIDETFASSLDECGCEEFHVWTVDSVDDAEYFQSLGAIGITTNRPAHIRAGIFEESLVE